MHTKTRRIRQIRDTAKLSVDTHIGQNSEVRCHREGIEAFLHANSFGEFWLYTTPDHGPTTRTHTQIYAVRRVYSAGTHPVASPPSPVSYAPVGSGITRRVRTEPLQPHPTFSSPESACASGTGWRRLQLSPPEWREYGRHGAWLTQSCPFLPLTPSPSPTPALPRQHGGGDRFFPCPSHRRRCPSSAHSYPPVTSASGAIQISCGATVEKQIFQPASVSLSSVCHLIGEPSGTTLAGPSVPQ